MSHQAPKGILRAGPSAGFEAEEVRKSELIWEAQLLRQEQQDEAAAEKFVQAAEMEERLSEVCQTQGLSEKSFVHRFSAASCWAQAGNFYRAISLCDELLAGPNLPSRLRQRVSDYAQTLRDRRSAWYAALLSHATAAEI